MAGDIADSARAFTTDFIDRNGEAFITLGGAIFYFGEMGSKRTRQHALQGALHRQRATVRRLSDALPGFRQVGAADSSTLSWNALTTWWNGSGCSRKGKLPHRLMM